MRISRRNLLYSLGSFGVATTLPILGCRKRSTPESTAQRQLLDPTVVRVLLEGPCIFTAPSNASATMQAIFPMDMPHVCKFGQWVGDQIVNPSGQAGSDPVLFCGANAWTATYSKTGETRKFSNLVSGAKAGVVLNDPNNAYTVNPDMTKDFILTLPSPVDDSHVLLGLPYKNGKITVGGGSGMTPYVTMVLKYPAPLTIDATASGMGKFTLPLGTDVVFRMTHTESASDPACKHIFEMVTSIDNRIVSSNPHPLLKLALTDTAVGDLTVDGDIYRSELGSDPTQEHVQTCSQTFQPRFDTLANCLGGNVVVGDGS